MLKSCKYAKNNNIVFAGLFCLMIYDSTLALKRYVTFDNWNKIIGITSDNNLYIGTNNYNSFTAFDDNSYWNNITYNNSNIHSFYDGDMPIDYDRMLVGTQIPSSSYAFIFKYIPISTL